MFSNSEFDDAYDIDGFSYEITLIIIRKPHQLVFRINISMVNSIFLNKYSDEYYTKSILEILQTRFFFVNCVYYNNSFFALKTNTFKTLSVYY